MTNQPTQPGRGWFGWLGRQIGYVRAAVHADPSKAPAERLVHREERVDEAPHPDDPQITLRRTTIDEAIVKPRPTDVE